MATTPPVSRRRAVVVLAAAVIVVLLLVLNPGGWRARVLARLLRVDNQPMIIAPPANFLPQVPSGFRVSVFAGGFRQPRWLAIAPDGDVFVADSDAGEIVVMHDAHHEGKAESRTLFADHLNLPFGIAFQGEYVYVAETNEVVRFRYDSTSSQRVGEAEPVLDLPGLGYHQHWTRSLAFSPDGRELFISVGSQSNEAIESDPRRAAILRAQPDGRNMEIFASGLRNAVGIAFNPESGAPWATVNERDDLGDDLPADYFTHVVEHGFYGWPYAYGDRHPDNRVSPRSDLAAKMIEPDVLLGAHVAPLQFAFYNRGQFPPEYQHGAFIAEHGSWNRRIRSGYQVVFVPFKNGMPAGEPKPFLTGLVPDAASKAVYGRPVGIAVAMDGSLLISDDAARVIWRVSYQP
jgi:glucose/arabinose dehydrogenase